MTDVDTAAKALSEAQTFCVKAGSFSSPLAPKMVVDGKMSRDMYIQLHLLASHVLTSKLMMCSHHLQVYGGKCSVIPHLYFRSLQQDLSLNVHQLLDVSGTGAHLLSSILKSATA
jgi:hypothetical protein